MDPKITAKKISKWRISRGLSREDLASKVGRSAISVWKWEKGGVSPSTEMLGDICRALGIQFVAFCVTDIENIPAPPSNATEEKAG